MSEGRKTELIIVDKQKKVGFYIQMPTGLKAWVDGYVDANKEQGMSATSLVIDLLTDLRDKQLTRKVTFENNSK